MNIKLVSMALLAPSLAFLTSPTPIFVKSDSTSTQIGTLIYNQGSNTYSFESSLTSTEIEGISNGELICFATEESCFTRDKIWYPLSGSITIHPHISKLEFVGEKVPNERVAKITVKVVSPLEGPVAGVKKVEKKVEKTKEELEKEEFEKKNFFQKYWMYMLPVGIILLMNGGGGQ